MNSKEYLISRLTSVLKLNGENVLCGNSKLSLTTSVLCLLNSVFVDILLHDQIESNNSYVNRFSQAFFEDAQYLQEFIRKTPSLKLFHGMQTIRGGVDLSQFASLCVLELKKIPAHLIVGLGTLSSQLKALICNRSINSLKELFGSSAEESSHVAIWTELKELNVSYNYLEELDDSLKTMPNIEIFDASRNSLKHLDELLMLDNLIVLNLSYNTLDHLPVLSCSSSCSLKVLFIRNNNLEDLQGLESLINLEEFDASYNCLTEYCVLKPLEKLMSLKSIHLDNNPFCLYKRHREVIMKYLHPRAINNGLCLDGKTLSPKEMSLVNTSLFRSNYSGSASGHQTSINVIVEDIANVTARSDQHYKILRKASGHKENDFDCFLEEKSNASSYSENTDEDSLVQKLSGKKSKKKHREAVILDPVHQYESPVPIAVKPTEEIPSHIQTKQLLEKRRKEYGTEWLLPSRTFQTLVSDSVIPTVPANTPVSSVPNVFSLSQHQLNFPSQFSTSLATALDISTRTDASEEGNVKSLKQLVVDLKAKEDNSSKSDIVINDKGDRKQSITSDDIQILSSHVVDEVMDGTRNSSAIDHQENVYAWTENSNDLEYSANTLGGYDSEEESEDRIFILDRKEKNRVYPLFVSLVGNYAKEKDFGTGKVADLLDLKNLLSVNLTTSLEGDILKYEIHLSFDSLKASNLKRLYISDNEESAKHMVSLLQPFADAKTLEDTTVGALECLKCSSQFSKQVADQKILKMKKPVFGQETLPSSYDSSKGHIQVTDICPNCGSNMVVEMDTVPIPSLQPPTKGTFINKFEKSSVKKTKNEVPESSSLPGSPSMGNQFSKLFPSMPAPSRHSKVPVTSTPSKTVYYSGNNSPKSTDGIQMPYYESDSSVQDAIRKEIRSDSDSTLVFQMRRNSSDITILSNASQSSAMSYDSDGGLNLDAIPEKDSLCSPTSSSPTISTKEFQKQKLPPQDSTLVSFNTTFNEPDSTGKSSTTKPLVQKLSFQSGPEYCKENPVTETSPLPSKKSSSQDCSENFQDCVESFGKNSLVVPPKDCMNESSRLIELLANKDVVNYENFSSIDHRLKLHLEISVFGNNEMLDACLEASVVPFATGEEFKGLCVISNKRIYIMKLLREIDEDVGNCVQQLHSWPLNQLKVISLLLGSQGFITTCGTDNKIHTFIVRDADYCNCFISYLTDIIRQYLHGSHIPEFETSTTEALEQLNEEVIFANCQQSSHDESDFEITLYLLVFWTNSATDKSNVKPAAIVVTQGDFFLVSLQFEKQSGYSKQPKRKLFHYVPLEKQKISNLVDIRLNENLKEAEFHFLDEDHNRVSQWYVVTQSKSSLFSLINSFKNPWEETFGIELPLCIQN